MMKKCIVVTCLTMTVGLLGGCGANQDPNIDKATTQEINTESVTSVISDTQQNQSNQQSESQIQDNGHTQVSISLEEAKKLVLDRVKGASKDDIKIKLDDEHGRYVYEGEVLYDKKEYEFEIDANTGTFLEWSEETK